MSLKFDPPNAEWTVTVAPLQVTPADPSSWINSTLGPGGTGEPVPFQTELGWRAVRIDLGATEGGDTRIAALYTMLHFVAAVVVAGRDLDDEAVMAFLRSARPDWTGGAPVAITELWK